MIRRVDLRDAPTAQGRSERPDGSTLAFGLSRSPRGARGVRWGLPCIHGTAGTPGQPSRRPADRRHREPRWWRRAGRLRFRARVLSRSQSRAPDGSATPGLRTRATGEAGLWADLDDGVQTVRRVRPAGGEEHARDSVRGSVLLRSFRGFAVSARGNAIVRHPRQRSAPPSKRSGAIRAGRSTKGDSGQMPAAQADGRGAHAGVGVAGAGQCDAIVRVGRPPHQDRVM
jgi:hypothetical protein